jgi:hypothetical protein
MAGNQADDAGAPAGPKRRSRARRLYRAWSWYNRAHKGFGWLSWLLAGKGGAAVGLVALGGLAATTAVSVTNPNYLPSLIRAAKPSGPVTVATQHWDNSVVFPIDGADKAGRKAGFDVVIKAKEITWVSGSTAEVARNGEPVPVGDVLAQLFGPEVQHGLAPSDDLIAVGLASHEGEVAAEQSRAERRGRMAAEWMGEAIAGHKRMWLLNLGRFQPNCLGAAASPDAQTSWERPFLVIGVRSQETGVNLSEALAEAMGGKTNLPSPECYSRFELTRLN